MREILETMSKLANEGKTFAVATIIKHTGSVPRHTAKMIIRSDGITFGTIGGGCVETEVVGYAMRLLREGQTGVHISSYNLVEEEFDGIGMNCGGKIDVAIEIIEPSSKLIIIGSGHLTEALTGIARTLGFQIVIVDPMARKETFPGASEVVTEFAAKGLPKTHVDKGTYVVILTRHKDDVSALKAALRTDTAYIGMIASRRRAALVFKQLTKRGVPRKEFERVYSPVGLDIGADTPEEIAVSIIAEIIKIKRLGQRKEITSKRFHLPPTK